MTQKKRSKMYKTMEMLLFCLPAFLMVTIFVYIPLANGISYSLYDWDGVSSDPAFVGLGNFFNLIHDKYFTGSVSYSVIYTMTNVVFINIFALFLAEFLSSKKLKCGGIMRTVFFAPNVVSLVVTAMIWMFIFSTAFASFVKATGWEFMNIDWFGNTVNARVVLFIVTAWVTSGYLMIIYVAGLNAIDSSVLEAAAIDGCSRLRLFLSVKLPLLMPSIVICVFWMTLYSLKSFDLPYVLTGGAPSNTTETLPMNMYSTAYQYSQYGYACAKGIVLFLIILTITIIELRVMKKREVEN